MTNHNDLEASKNCPKNSFMYDRESPTIVYFKSISFHSYKSLNFHPIFQLFLVFDISQNINKMFGKIFI